MSELRSDVVSEIDNKLLHNAHNKYNRSDNSNSSNINSAVRKFRSYNKSAEGAVSIELKTPEYVQKCIDIFNGRMFDGRRIVAERCGRSCLSWFIEVWISQIDIDLVKMLFC